MSTILKLENICYGYEDGGYRREILKNLSYEFEAGTFYTILGPSGSGKTTLLSIMAGLDKQEAGTEKRTKKPPQQDRGRLSVL